MRASTVPRCMKWPQEPLSLPSVPKTNYKRNPAHIGPWEIDVTGAADAKDSVMVGEVMRPRSVVRLGSPASALMAMAAIIFLWASEMYDKAVRVQ